MSQKRLQNDVDTFSKMVNFFFSFFAEKAQNCVYFVPFDFVQISPACGPHTYQIMYGLILDFQYERQ